MVKRMLIDATHPEETRVVVVNGTRLEELDVETSTKKQIKGNIYLAKVIRVEPSLQAAFVDYGGNRHGFLAFSEIHPDYFQIPVADRQALLAAQNALSAPFGNDSADSDMPQTLEEPGGEVPQTVTAAMLTDFGSDSVTDQGAFDQDSSNGGDPQFTASEPQSTSPDAEVGFPGDVNSSDAAVDGQSEGQSGYDRHEAEGGSDDTSEREGAGHDDHGRDDHRSSDENEQREPQAPEVLGGDDAGEQELARRRARLLRNYKIQEVIKRRQIMLVQVVKEERGNKGAALTTYLSLAGRYCVLMPNTARGGGVSRKIINAVDRKRLKAIAQEMEVPEGMAVIVRTAGSERSKLEIKRDYEYLLRMWDTVRELTLQSSAPTLVYEEASIIKRSIRDLYARDIDEVLVDGEEGYRLAKDYMRMLTPSHAKKVQPYRDPTMPMFHRYQVETQLDAMHSPVVQLRSGGYIVIGQTEALVAIDVNSGRATRERHIEETALKTNLEAADEVARQLRLRDLAGLIVIDFIDMEESRNNYAVERRLKEALKNDRARIQVGRISAFGLLELSRQRLRPSLQETAFTQCPHCAGTGLIRSVESSAMAVLRAIEEEGIRARSAEVTMWVPTPIALYILNHKRAALGDIEARYGLCVIMAGDDTLIAPNWRMDRVKAEFAPGEVRPVLIPPPRVVDEADLALDDVESESESEEGEEDQSQASSTDTTADGAARRRRRRRRRGRGQQPNQLDLAAGDDETSDQDGDESAEPKPSDATGEATGEQSGDEQSGDDGLGAGPPGETAEERSRRRRRGRRGGRRRHRGEAIEGERAPESAVENVQPVIMQGPAHLTRDDVADVFEAAERAEEAAMAARAAAAAALAAAPSVVVAEEPVAAAHADDASAGSEEPADGAAPKRKRAPRKKAVAVDAAEGEQTVLAEEAAPKRKRTPRKKPTEAEEAAPVLVESDTTPALPSEPTVQPVPEAAVAEPAPVAAPVEPSPPVAAPVEEQAPAGPPRKGWWNKLLS